MKKKKGTEDDRKLLPADVLAHKQKENTEGEDSLLLPAEVHTSKPNKRRSVEESVLLPDKRTPKKKEPRGADEGNRIPADVPTSKQKKKTREGKKQVAQAVGLSDQGKAKAEKEMEEENVLLPATGCTKKETMQEAGAVFPADRNSLKKRKKPEEKDDGVLPADVQRTKKMLEEETENRWVVLADVRKTKKKRREENTLPADGATDKHKKKKKEKERAQEEQENVLAADGFTKKKRRVEEEEKDSSLPPGFQVKKKKKKKRTEEEEVTMATEPTGNKKRSTSAPLVDAEIGRPPVTAGEAEESEDSDGVETGTTYDELLDPVLVAELEEFIPNVKKRSTDEIRKLLRYDLDRFRLFKEQGVSIRWGRFTQEENLRLQDNMAHFLAVTGIASADHLLFPHRYGDREAADVKKLKRRHGFLGAMAEGIPRPCKLVWSRALKLDDMNHMGQFSDEEVAQLLKLQKLHGNDWRSIAAKTGRSRYALQKRFAQIASGQGNWTAEEEGRLQEAVKAHLEAVSLQSCSASQDGLLNLQQLCTGLPWTDISQHVRTRCWTQCRIKWCHLVSFESHPSIWYHISMSASSTRRHPLPLVDDPGHAGETAVPQLAWGRRKRDQVAGRREGRLGHPRDPMLDERGMKHGWTDGWLDQWMDGRMAGSMDGQMDARMDGWMDQWTDEWMDALMDGRMAGSMDGWTDGWINGWTDGWLDQWMDGRMAGSMDGQMDGCTDGWTDGWINGWMDGWLDQWMDGRMVGSMDGRTDGWINGWMHGWMAGWINGWMDALMDGRTNGWTDAQTDRWTDVYPCQVAGSTSSVSSHSKSNKCLA
ncbi:uncharacterized protein LOC144049113 isoform X1 [Vanacampus margaritifer]